MLSNFGITQVRNATYHVSRPSVHWFHGKRFLKIITTYWHGQHVGHGFWTFEQVFFPQPQTALHRIWPGSFWGDIWSCHTTKVLGQKPKIELDLLYSLIFMYSLRQLNISEFRPNLKNFHESFVLEFPHIWPCCTKGQGQPKLII